MCNVLSVSGNAPAEHDGHIPATVLEMSEQSDKPERLAHYDREVDIVWISTSASRNVFGDEQPWGLIVRDRNDESVAGIEIWSASKYLPADLLAALPPPAPVDEDSG